jgi:hypothetical protein
VVYPLESPVAQWSPSFFGGCTIAGNLVRVISAQSSFNVNGTTAWSISNVSLVAL